MSIHTVTCPECGNTQEVDLPAGQTATMQHQATQPGIGLTTQRVSHLMRVRPRVMPIERPERSERPPREETQPPSPGPFNQPVDLNRGD